MPNPPIVLGVGAKADELEALRRSLRATLDQMKFDVAQAAAEISSEQRRYAQATTAAEKQESRTRVLDFRAEIADKRAEIVQLTAQIRQVTEAMSFTPKLPSVDQLTRQISAFHTTYERETQRTQVLQAPQVAPVLATEAAALASEQIVQLMARQEELKQSLQGVITADGEVTTATTEVRSRYEELADVSTRLREAHERLQKAKEEIARTTKEGIKTAEEEKKQQEDFNKALEGAKQRYTELRQAEANIGAPQKSNAELLAENTRRRGDLNRAMEQTLTRLKDEKVSMEEKKKLLADLINLEKQQGQAIKEGNTLQRRESGEPQFDVRRTLMGFTPMGALQATGIGAAVLGVVDVIRNFDRMIDSVVRLGDEVPALADKFEQMGARVGLSGAELQRWSVVAQTSGVDVEMLTRSITLLSRKLVGGGTAGEEGMDQQALSKNEQLLRALGVAVRTTGNEFRDVNDIMIDVAEAVSRMPNGFEKTKIMIELFGRAGAGLIPLFNNGGEALRRYLAETERLGMTEEQFKKLSEAHSKLEMAQGNLKVAWASLKAEFSGTEWAVGMYSWLTRIVEKINEFRRGVPTTEEIQRMREGLKPGEAVGAVGEGTFDYLYKQAIARAQRDAALTEPVTVKRELLKGAFPTVGAIDAIRKFGEVSEVAELEQRRDAELRKQARGNEAEFLRLKLQDQQILDAIVAKMKEATSESERLKIAEDGVNEALRMRGLIKSPAAAKFETAMSDEDRQKEAERLLAIAKRGTAGVDAAREAELQRQALQSVAGPNASAAALSNQQKVEYQQKYNQLLAEEQQIQRAILSERQAGKTPEEAANAGLELEKKLQTERINAGLNADRIAKEAAAAAKRQAEETLRAAEETTKNAAALVAFNQRQLDANTVLEQSVERMKAMRAQVAGLGENLDKVSTRPLATGLRELTGILERGVLFDEATARMRQFTHSIADPEARKTMMELEGQFNSAGISATEAADKIAAMAQSMSGDTRRKAFELAATLRNVIPQQELAAAIATIQTEMAKYEAQKEAGLAGTRAEEEGYKRLGEVLKALQAAYQAAGAAAKESANIDAAKDAANEKLRTSQQRLAQSVADMAERYELLRGAEQNIGAAEETLAQRIERNNQEREQARESVEALERQYRALNEELQKAKTANADTTKIEQQAAETKARLSEALGVYNQKIGEGSQLAKQAQAEALSLGKAWQTLTEIVQGFGVGLPKVLVQLVAMIETLRKLKAAVDAMETTKSIAPKVGGLNADQFGNILTGGGTRTVTGGGALEVSLESAAAQGEGESLGLPTFVFSGGPESVQPSNRGSMGGLLGMFAQLFGKNSKFASSVGKFLPGIAGIGMGAGLGGMLGGTLGSIGGAAIAGGAAIGMTSFGSMLGLGAAAGPVGWIVAGIGAALMGLGVIGEKAKRKTAEIAQQLSKEMNDTINRFNTGASTLKQTIADLEAQRTRAIATLSGRKGGKEQLEPLLQSLDSQLSMLKGRQKEIIEQFQTDLRLLRVPEQYRSTAKALEDLNKQIKDFIDAGGSAAEAAEFFALSLKDMQREASAKLRDETQSTIQNMMRIIDMEKQRDELVQARLDMVRQEREQEASIRDRGVMVQRQSFAQQQASEIQKLRENLQKQLDKTDEQLEKSQYELDLLHAQTDAKAEFFGLESDLAELRTQMLDIERAITAEQIAQLKATQELLTSVNYKEGGVVNTGTTEAIKKAEQMLAGIPEMLEKMRQQGASAAEIAMGKQLLEQLFQKQLADAKAAAGSSATGPNAWIYANASGPLAMIDPSSALYQQLRAAGFPADMLSRLLSGGGIAPSGSYTPFTNTNNVTNNVNVQVTVNGSNMTPAEFERSLKNALSGALTDSRMYVPA